MSKYDEAYSKTGNRRYEKRCRDNDQSHAKLYRVLDSTIKPKSKLKYFIQAINSTGASGAIGIFFPVQGDDITHRKGREVLLKRLQVRMEMCNVNSVQVPPTTTDNVGVQSLRLIVYIDQAVNGAAAATTDLLLTANVNSPLNLSSRDRIKIIHDETWGFDPYISTGATQLNAQNQCHIVQFEKDLNVKTVFNAGNAGTSADTQSNGLRICMVGGADTQTTSYFKTYFVDL
jgi:hypothetical protein